MEQLFIDSEQPEWAYMWGLLAKHPLNAGLEEPRVAENHDETWQYMDTSIYDGEPMHSFRHRCHPRTQDRAELYFPVSHDLRSAFPKLPDSRRDMELTKK